VLVQVRKQMLLD